MASSDIEKKSLEAHVELCAERYKNLDERLRSLDDRMDNIERLIVELKGVVSTPAAKEEDSTGPYKMMLTIGTTIGGALIGALITLIVHIK
jgi:chromosome segregation ATPase